MIDALLLLLLPLTLLGQLLRFEPTPGITIYPHDGIIVLLGLMVASSTHHRRQLIKLGKFVWQQWKFFLCWMVTSVLLQVMVFDESPVILLYLLRTGLYLSFLGWLFLYFKHAHKKVILVYWTSGLVFACITLGLYLVFPDMRALKSFGWDDHYYRAVGSLLDPNFTGAVLVISILSLLRLFSVHFHKLPIVSYGAIGLMSIALSLTFSRASWLSFSVGLTLVLLSVFNQLKGQFWRATTSKLVITTLILMMITIVIAPKPGGEGVNLLRSASIVARQTHDSSSLSISPSRLLLGSGLSTSPTDSISYHARLPNNLAMLILAFAGIPGLFIFIWNILLSFKLIRNTYPQLLVPILVLLVLAQFNAVLTEPFTLLLCGFQLLLVTTDRRVLKPI